MVKASRRQHYEMMTLTEEQARALIESAKGDRYEAVYVLALSTGMREGETFALRWQEVDLRHTCATLLLSKGVNVKVVSEMLGHSDIAITLRIYAHAMPGCIR